MYLGTGLSKFVLNEVDYEFSEVMEIECKTKMDTIDITAMDGTIRELVLGYYHNFDYEMSLATSTEINNWKILCCSNCDNSSLSFRFSCHIPVF